MSTWLNPAVRPTPWTSVGPASEKLVSSLTELFWEGVTREVAYTIQAQKLFESQTPIPEEENIKSRVPHNAFGFLSDWGTLLLASQNRSSDSVIKLLGISTSTGSMTILQKLWQYS